MTLTGTGVWSAGLRYGDPARIGEAASDLDRSGYSALWVPDGGRPVFDVLDAARLNHVGYRGSWRALAPG